MKMRKTLLTALLLLGALTHVCGQEVYNEGMKMAKEAADAIEELMIVARTQKAALECYKNEMEAT